MTESKKSSEKSNEKIAETKADIVGEQKLASAERVVSAGGSLAGGPSQDDLNPAYAPPKEDLPDADAKA